MNKTDNQHIYANVYMHLYHLSLDSKNMYENVFMHLNYICLDNQHIYENIYIHLYQLCFVNQHVYENVYMHLYHKCHLYMLSTVRKCIYALISSLYVTYILYNRDGNQGPTDDKRKEGTLAMNLKYRTRLERDFEDITRRVQEEVRHLLIAPTTRRN